MTWSSTAFCSPMASMLSCTSSSMSTSTLVLSWTSPTSALRESILPAGLGLADAGEHFIHARLERGDLGPVLLDVLEV